VGRPDLLVTSGDHTGPNKNIVVTSISKAFDRDAPIVALAMAPDGYLIVTATSDAIVPAGIEKNLFDSGNEAALPDSAGATALVFLDTKIFASGGADGTVRCGTRRAAWSSINWQSSRARSSRSCCRPMA
jgi:hypothetical protein